jgi:hypothetical protein
VKPRAVLERALCGVLVRGASRADQSAADPGALLETDHVLIAMATDGLGFVAMAAAETSIPQLHIALEVVELGTAGLHLESDHIGLRLARSAVD